MKFSAAAVSLFSTIVLVAAAPAMTIPYSASTSITTYASAATPSPAHGAADHPLNTTASSDSCHPHTSVHDPKRRFRHHPGAQNGVYGHRMGLDGIVHTTYLGPHDENSNATHPAVITKGATATSTQQDKRGYVPQGVVCQSLTIPESDVTNAVNGLGAQFGGSLTWYHAISSVYGSAVAYGCDYANGQTIGGVEMTGYQNSISAQCGADKEGYFRLPYVKSSYGRTVAGNGFC